MTLVEKIKIMLQLPPGYRLGQHIWNEMKTAGKWEAPEANSLFYISDEDLNKIICAQIKPKAVLKSK